MVPQRRPLLGTLALFVVVLIAAIAIMALTIGVSRDDAEREDIGASAGLVWPGADPSRAGGA